jgi:type III secretion system FlhB-like substrate exporter
MADATERCIRATLVGKIDDLRFPSLRVYILIRKISAVGAFGGDGIMNPRRFATVAAALCGTAVLAGWVVASLAGFGSAGIENTGAVPIEDRRAPSLTADAELADAPQATAMGNAAVANAVVATAAESGTGTATDTTPASDEPKSIVEAALPDLSQVLPPESPPVQVATASTPDPVPNDLKEAASPIEILDECLIPDSCIDRYLWALYQRAPKVDTIKMHELRKVTVKKKGKTVTVTKSFTKLVDEDFTWKDPKAAEKASMPVMDYVIGGMDRSFTLKLFHMLRAAEEAGLSPGITSAFRDDYRQSIASGLKAATDRSYHGGSFRGGYGHGLAADVVSVKGATPAQRWISTESLWKWIDAHGKEFGIGRPYLDKDPAHLAPIDGKEYAAHHPGTKVQPAGSDMKRNRLAVRDDHSVAKRPRTARSSKVRTI